MAASTAVSVTSLPPGVLLVESVSGGDPEKQVSASVPVVGPVRQPTGQACERVQLFV